MSVQGEQSDQEVGETFNPEIDTRKVPAEGK